MKFRISDFKLRTDRLPAARTGPGLLGGSQFAIRHVRAFTLIELLTVITILGILAALTVPALKEMGKANVQASATRQMLDAVARARQLAISRHTKVYMVFVPPNFFSLVNDKNQNVLAGLQTPANFANASEQADALTALTNLIPLQMTGYNYLSLGRVGDQPGQHQWAYLADWDSLPDGTFIPWDKFQLQNAGSISIPLWQQDYNVQIDAGWTAPADPLPITSNFQVNQICGFTRHWVPFPTEKSPLVYLPCLVFDYQGRLISEVDTAGGYHHAYIPLAQGTVSYGVDVNKQPQPTAINLTSDVVEKPPGNSTNISYTVIDVNPLTGRAELQQFKMQ
jgi:prepilin-type N-terminal cleavage/methylation domain-containing protein